MGKGKRVDVYLEVRKRRGHIFFGMKQVPVTWVQDLFFIIKKMFKISYLECMFNFRARWHVLFKK